MTLSEKKNKALLFVVALVATVMLMAAPIAPAYADCQSPGQTSCGG